MKFTLVNRVVLHFSLYHIPVGFSNPVFCITGCHCHLLQHILELAGIQEKNKHK
jgi:hypothetical protein